MYKAPARNHFNNMLHNKSAEVAGKCHKIQQHLDAEKSRLLLMHLRRRLEGENHIFFSQLIVLTLDLLLNIV